MPKKISKELDSPKLGENPVAASPPTQPSAPGPDLADRLRNNPASLWDSSVQQEFISLGSLAYGLDAGEREKARERLQEIIQAFAQGALGPGYTLRPPPGKPGRKPTQERVWLAGTAFDDYERILRLLQDSRQAFLDRLKPPEKLTADQLKRVLHERRHERRSRAGRRTTEERQAEWITPLLRDLCQKAGFSDSQMPPDEKLLRWAKAAIKKRTVSLDALAYQFVAWRWNKLTEQPWQTVDTASWGEFTPNKVRHLVQTWRKVEKALQSGLRF